MSETDLALDIIHSAKSGSEAVIALIQLKRERRSLNFIAKRLSIASSGYIADVVSQRRPLSKKYVKALVQMYDLPEQASKVVETLLTIDKSKPDDVQNDLLWSQIAKLRKTLLVRRVVVPKLDAAVYSAIELIAAFGIFDNRAEKLELLRCYPSSRRDEIKAGLKLLVDIGVVEVKGTDLILRWSEVKFETNDPNSSFSPLMKKSIENAAIAVDEYYALREKAHFETAVLTMSSSRLAAALEEFRNALQESYSKMEEPTGDMMLRINIQAYPALTQKLYR